MPNVFGRQVNTIEDSLAVIRDYGDGVAGTYRARYRWDSRSDAPYNPAVLERPPALRDNPPGVTFPWEQIFVAAATCAGSDYPALATHLGIPLEQVEFVVEGVFDPRGEFDGLSGFEAPASVKHCYPALHLRTTLKSPAAREALEGVHARVVSRNMVLDALRGIPSTHELVIETPTDR